MEANQYTTMYEFEDIHWWFLAKRDFISSVLPIPQKNLSILDIGSGTGGMTSYLQAWGKVLSIEPSNSAALYLKKRGIPFKKMSVGSFRCKTNTFDLICMLDVLYHKSMPNESSVLQKVYSWLKPGGILCITDCAVPILYSLHDRNMHAKKRYWLSELAQEIRNAHLTIQKATYIYFFTFPLFAISRLIDKFIPLNTISRMPSPINTILFALCKLESRLLRYINFPIGSSVLIVAQKS